MVYSDFNHRIHPGFRIPLPSPRGPSLTALFATGKSRAFGRRSGAAPAFTKEIATYPGFRQIPKIGWWFGTFLFVLLGINNPWHQLTSIFRRGWKHQPDIVDYMIFASHCSPLYSHNWYDSLVQSALRDSVKRQFWRVPHSCEISILWMVKTIDFAASISIFVGETTVFRGWNHHFSWVKPPFFVGSNMVPRSIFHDFPGALMADPPIASSEDSVTSKTWCCSGMTVGW